MKVVSYICDKCKRSFNNENDYNEHIECCQKSFPIKGIFVERRFLKNENEDQQLTIIINHYKNAVLIDKNMICLVPDSRYRECVFTTNLNLLFLYKITTYDEGEYFGIYTTNFSEEYENECIEKILKKLKEDHLESLESYKKDIERNVKIIDDKKYKIDRDEECRVTMGYLN